MQEPTVVPAPPAAHPRLRAPLQFTHAQRHRLREVLDSRHANYDPAERLLKLPFSSPGYHTTLTGGHVHPTKQSLDYALSCLDVGDAALHQRGQDVLQRIIQLQDQDPSSRTYGIWSWFLEEPLPQMSPPDWNWADFNGHTLLQIALDHRPDLPPQLMARLDAAVQHAARSIQRRNVTVSYTNIAILGTYVTLVAAEMYDLDDLRQYARDRLRRLHAFTMQQGGFIEYNSPTYTMVSLEALSRLAGDLTDADDRQLVDELVRIAWEEVALHFHVPARQWGGPHSRCYSTLLRGGALRVIELGTDGRIHFGADWREGFTRAGLGVDELRVRYHCPPDLESCFVRLDAPRTLVRTVRNRVNVPIAGDRPTAGDSASIGPTITTTYLHPAFTLASANRECMWNQRRPLIAYWGTAQSPSYLAVRLLHDGYDFASAQIFTAQRDGLVIAILSFATDGGDRHISLDAIQNATIHASDLRLRFEFGGAAAAESSLRAPTAMTDPIELAFGDLRLRLCVPFARFDDRDAAWEITAAGATRHLDLVLFHAAERALRLSDLATTAIGLSVEFSPNAAPVALPSASLSDGTLTVENSGLRLAVPARPGPVHWLQSAAQISTPL